MIEALVAFNRLSAHDAERQLLACCASPRWASRVAAGRPYHDLGALLEMADAVWLGLTPDEWLAALAGHPRIGERGGHSPASSEREQSAVRKATGETIRALEEENRRYEARFGHVFLISATGRNAEDILTALRQRMHNDPVTEVRVAADEHRKITRLRLERMLRA